MPEWVALLMGWPKDWVNPEPMKLEDFHAWLQLQDPWADGWEDGIARVASGISHRVDKLKCLGNGQVPQCAALAWTILCEK